jgi:GntP family gluconate:H+ symporter
MAVVIAAVLLLRLHAFFALLLGALVVGILTPSEAIQQFALARGLSDQAARQLSQTPFADRVAEGFGRTCGQIGIVIAMASIIGDCLLRSGAADRIVRSALKVMGERRAGQAFLGSGYLLGIPVFFDTVFYLIIPLVKAMRLRTGKDYVLYVLAVVAGGTMTHSLVPPTPGPLFVANELGVDLGVMIIAGCIVGAFTSAAGYGYAIWANKVWELPLRETSESMSQLEELSKREDSRLPSTLLSLAPIVLPVLLIAASATLSSGSPAGGDEIWQTRLITLVTGLGDKNIALIIGAIIALLIMLKTASAEQTTSAVKDALTSAGVIILITGAGGAFGGVLQQTGIGGTIQQLSSGYQIPILPLAFVLTTLIRTAQGSATVAMITAAGAFAGLATSGQLSFHPVYLALVIGCGSKPIWWMNDSGFWVVSQMSGMTEREALKMLTPGSALAGVVGLIVIMIAAAIFPLT